ncbi:MAG: EthD family reductase [Pseudomonadota bacterium]|nr:EthD family reductase [Pseudomonadota bacterium]
MIKLSVMYPHTAGARFDHDYYRDVHLPMLQQRMGGHLLYYTIEKGLSGIPPGSAPPYVALCHLYCASPDALLAGVGPHAAEFAADVANFTDIVSVQQISEVVVERSV